MNGAMVFNTAGKLIVNEPIPKDQSIKINRLLKDSGFYFEIVAADNVYSDSRLRRIANFSDLLVDLNKKLTFKKAVSFAAGSDEIMRIKYVSDFKDLLEKPNFEAMKFVAFHPDRPTDQINFIPGGTSVFSGTCASVRASLPYSLINHDPGSHRHV